MQSQGLLPPTSCGVAPKISCGLLPGAALLSKDAVPGKAGDGDDTVFGNGFQNLDDPATSAAESSFVLTCLKKDFIYDINFLCHVWMVRVPLFVFVFARPAPHGESGHCRGPNPAGREL